MIDRLRETADEMIRENKMEIAEAFNAHRMIQFENMDKEQLKQQCQKVLQQMEIEK